ncbi:DegT/DnrJ/EryC1/StrS family aminotransferase [Yinghuangia aomiensis]
MRRIAGVRRRCWRRTTNSVNYRMTDVQAAIGLVQLGRLDAMAARRRSWPRGTASCWPAPGLRLVDDPEFRRVQLPGVLQVRDEVLPGGLNPAGRN